MRYFGLLTTAALFACSPLSQADAVDGGTGDGTQGDGTDAAPAGTAADDTVGQGGSQSSGNLPDDDDDDDNDDDDDDDDGLCASDAECSDDVFCNGAETCDPEAPESDEFGCIAGGGNPCDSDRECNDEFDICVGPCGEDPDADNDGEDSVACGGTDCNDEDENINTAATEVCDGAGVDEDCNPMTDDADLLGTETDCSSCGDVCNGEQECFEAACSRTRRVFLSSDVRDGNMGSAQNADEQCQALADAESLGGAWRAYIIDPGAGLDRHETEGGPFRKLDGTLVANDWADLTDESIESPINLTELMTTPGGNVWTGFINVGGSPMTNSCNGWTSNTDGCLMNDICGGGGESGMTDNHWDGFFIFDCDALFRLYCIEQ